MFDFLGLDDEARRVMSSIERVVTGDRSGLTPRGPPDMGGGGTTTAVGDALIAALEGGA
ncbi:MAG: hypothetical protein MJA84_15220 [Firmicutes bacterium]|nr:hypothetical protein [Bacillota bacterium]